MNLFGFGGSSRKKNSKANRLRRMVSQITKLEKKKAVNTALQKAQQKLNTLRRGG